MAITIGDKVYRNLQEQVEHNKKKIEEHYARDRVLADYGITVLGKLASEDDIPDGEYNYGDAFMIGTEEPYHMWIYTRNVVENKGFTDAGALSVQGPKGDTGPEGASIQNLERVSEAVHDNDRYTVTDNTIRTTLTDGTTKSFVVKAYAQKGSTGAVGPQGPQGEPGVGFEGPQGPQGAVGPTGSSFHLVGVVASADLLPTPQEVGDRSAAYLVGEESPYLIYAQAGETDEDLMWYEVSSGSGGSCLWELTDNGVAVPIEAVNGIKVENAEITTLKITDKVVDANGINLNIDNSGSTAPSVTASTAPYIIFDVNSNQVLVAKNRDTVSSAASTATLNDANIVTAFKNNKYNAYSLSCYLQIKAGSSTFTTSTQYSVVFKRETSTKYIGQFRFEKITLGNSIINPMTLSFSLTPKTASNPTSYVLCSYQGINTVKRQNYNDGYIITQQLNFDEDLFVYNTTYNKIRINTSKILDGVYKISYRTTAQYSFTNYNGKSGLLSINFLAQDSYLDDISPKLDTALNQLLEQYELRATLDYDNNGIIFNPQYIILDSVRGYIDNKAITLVTVEGMSNDTYIGNPNHKITQVWYRVTAWLSDGSKEVICDLANYSQDWLEDETDGWANLGNTPSTVDWYGEEDPYEWNSLWNSQRLYLKNRHTMYSSSEWEAW